MEGVSAKNFDTQRIPSLQPLVDEPGADAIVTTHVDPVATKSTKNQKNFDTHRMPKLQPLVVGFVAPDMKTHRGHAPAVRSW